MNASLDIVTFGLISWLEQRSDVTNLYTVDYEAAHQNTLDAWEELCCALKRDNNKCGCKLPRDLKEFYMTMNGLLITWSVQLQGSVVPVGLLEVNPIESLNGLSLRYDKTDDTRITLQDIESSHDYETNATRKPRFDDKCFELSSDGKHGKVCVVYDNNSHDYPSIWFLDRALQWHHLAQTFHQYFRMLISHCGIEGWQLLYTDFGLSPECQEWFSYFLPQKLPSNHCTTDSNGDNAIDSPPSLTNRTVEKHNIDFSNLFKHRSSHNSNTDKKRANPAKTEQRRQKNSQQIGVKSKGNDSTNRPPAAAATMATKHSKNAIAR